MTLASVRDSIDGLVGHLPFDIDNIAAINALYASWHKKHDHKKRKVIDIWTYCYVQRYMMKKFVVRKNKDSADLDMLIDTAFENAQAYQSNIKKSTIYAHWVSVICKNVFMNYVQRKFGSEVSIEAFSGFDIAEEKIEVDDPAIIMDVINRSINNLPVHLQVIARRSLIDSVGYSVLSTETKYSEGTLRSYVNKIRKAMMKDPVFDELNEKIFS